jgi:acylphosphatase
VKAVRAVVTGRVQGVGFRWSARRAAERIGVAGWVRNRADGSVEAHVEGPEERVDSMLSWLREGPDGADVRGVEADDAEAEGGVGFRIR